jgi:hypothetical protein
MLSLRLGVSSLEFVIYMKSFMNLNVKNNRVLCLRLILRRLMIKLVGIFLFLYTQKFGFNPTMCGWIKQLVVGVTRCVKINSILG